MKVFLINVLLCCCLNINGWKLFHRKRSFNRNIGFLRHNKTLHAIKEIPDQWFDQRLDHFSPTDTRTWGQRYFTNNQFYNQNIGGPVFLMISGEETADPQSMIFGAWIEYAQKFGALCFLLEHRFYGKSLPTIDISTTNLQYLTSQQALADLAEFITAINKEYNFPSNVKWIIFGGSYAGSLAAWMRLKYPHLVHAAVSSSGPLLAKVDFREFYQVVEESLKAYSKECVNEIQKAILQLNVLLTSDKGQQRIDRAFKLCNPIEHSVNNPNDISSFYDLIAGYFAYDVQYNNGIDTLCNIMTNKSIRYAVDRLAVINSLYLFSNCMDYNYKGMIMEYRKSQWNNEDDGDRQWLYQMCTEFGFFQTSTFISHVFPVEYFIQMCMDVFGPNYNSRFLNTSIDQTNMFYGGKGIEVSNVVFVQGSIDPWHPLGITKTVNQDAPAIYIEGTSHCADMLSSLDSDLPQLKAARKQIERYLDTWIRL